MSDYTPPPPVIDTAHIADGSVTLAKLANLATDKVIGRQSAGTGVPEAVTCTAAGRALIDDADASAQRTTLGLGTLATQNGTFSGTSSGTNTGDVTLGAVGAAPSANAASLSGQVLTLQPADLTHPGVVTTGSQTFDGVKTFNAAPVLSGASITSASVPNSALANSAVANLSGTNTGDVSLGAVGSSPSANAASLSGQVLTLQPADLTHPGVVTTGAQTWDGIKTFNAAPVLSGASITSASIPNSALANSAVANLSGTNTGDVTLGAVGASPSANGASLSGQVLTLQPADATHPGVITSGTQTFAGNKTFNNTILSQSNISGDSVTASGGPFNARSVGSLTAGSPQTTGGATTLNGGVNVVTTVTTAGDGVRINNNRDGSRVFVANRGANQLKLYPFTGEALQLEYAAALGTDVATTLDPGTFAVCERQGTVWHVWKSKQLTMPVISSTSSPVTVSATVENGTLYDNVGAGATQITHNMPAVTVGMIRKFAVKDSGGIVIKPNGTDQIYLGTALTTASTGTLTSTAAGSYVVLVGLTSGFWIAESFQGTWTTS